MSLRQRLGWLEKAVGRMILIHDALAGKQPMNANEQFVFAELEKLANSIIGPALGNIEQINQYYRYAVDKGKTPETPKNVADIVFTDKAIQQKVTVSDSHSAITEALQKAAQQLAGTFGEHAGDRRRAIQIFIYTKDNPWPYTTVSVYDLNLLKKQVEADTRTAIALACTGMGGTSTLSKYLSKSTTPTKVSQSQTTSRFYQSTQIASGPPQLGYVTQTYYNSNPSIPPTQVTTQQYITPMKTITTELNTVEIKIRWLKGRLVRDPTSATNISIYGFKLRAYFANVKNGIVQCEVTKTYQEDDEY